MNKFNECQLELAESRMESMDMNMLLYTYGVIN